MFVKYDGLFIEHVIKKDNLYGFFTGGQFHIFGWCSRFQVFVIARCPTVVLTHGVMYWILLAARKLAAGLKGVTTPVIRAENLTESGI